MRFRYAAALIAMTVVVGLCAAMRRPGAPLASSSTSNRPTLQLWGNATAADAFAHPLIADAADSLFIRVPQTDGPARMRVINSAGTELCPATDDLSVAAVSRSMV